MMTATNLAYRMASAEGASGLGLLVALCDTLAGDLRRAAEAQRNQNLEQRSRELTHALAVMGILENWIDPQSGELAQKLMSLYGAMRRNIMQAQALQSAEMLEEQMKTALSMREVWQKLDQEPASSGPEVLPPMQEHSYAGACFAHAERPQLSWSA
jgi:flagellar protein FliS